MLFTSHVDSKHVSKYVEQEIIMKIDKRDSNGQKPRRYKDNGNNVTEKKPFDKKKYRLQKYSNKYKVAQWEERRKKAVLRGFYKDLHKDERGAPQKPLHLKTTETAEPDDSSNPKKKKSAFFAAKKEFQKQKAEKQKKKDELLKSKAEREDALNNYKEKKMQTYKKLSRKTKKGQPVMKDRLEMLLEKIKESVS